MGIKWYVRKKLGHTKELVDKFEAQFQAQRRLGLK